MVFGILGHVIRFAIYALGGPLWLVIASNVVHGFCYAFFFASIYIFVDEKFPRDSRASAQSLFNFLILGAGPFFGNLLWGKLGDVYRDGGGRRLLAAVPRSRGHRPRSPRSSCSSGFHPDKTEPAVTAKAA